jgi:cytochrome c oxidase subunit 1
VTDNAFQLDIAPGPARQQARAWLWLGVAALIGAGLLAILLVLSRTPGIQDVFPLREFFRAALVVHVDLSVLIWFMAFACVLWSLGAAQPRLVAFGWLGFWLAAAGTAVMAISPFFPDTQPLLNNYIPMLQQPVFYFGLSLAGAGFGVTILRTVVVAWPEQPAANGAEAMRFGVFLGALAGLSAWIALLLSLNNAPNLSGQAYYETLFWGGGHALQFQHTLLAAVAWFWLASALGAVPPLKPGTTALLFALAALPLIAALAIYALWPVGSAQHLAYFARLMEFGHPLMWPLLVVALLAVWRTRAAVAPAASALRASVLLFCVGGFLAYLIRGVNVVIPAHYHGSIVGVTLAFMGLAYVLLPRLGFAAAEGRMARWQPYVYGGGQLMHVLGLAWSGGYGVQRKVAGAEQMLTTLPQKIGMGFMGLGGVIAIVGGIMFVLVCLKAMWPRR